MPGAEGFIRVKTTDGRVLEQALVRPQDLTQYSEIREKFYACAVPVVGQSKASEIESQVSRMEQLESVTILTPLLQQ